MKADFLHKLWRMVFCIFMAIVCSGQVYQSVHLHHFHSDSTISFKVSAHPPYADIGHTSSHHHHEENTSHEDENEHNYKKLAVWRNVFRAKASVDVSFDFAGLPALTDLLPITAFEAPKFYPTTLPYPEECNLFYKGIRGPPLHG